MPMQKQAHLTVTRSRETARTRSDLHVMRHAPAEYRVHMAHIDTGVMQPQMANSVSSVSLSTA